jgi:hypothetical protein
MIFLLFIIQIRENSNHISSFCRMQLQPTYSHGSPDSNGMFDGMLGMLQRGEAQLGITSLTMLPQRLAAVDFTAPTWEFRLVSVSEMLILKQAGEP